MRHMVTLMLAFFATALLYSSVGFGGGSTYAALLVLADTDYRAIPIVSLLCNLVVVTLGGWHFARAGNVPWRRIWPLLSLSVPLAWLGGRLPVSQLLFVGLLSASLFVAGLAMLWRGAPLPDDSRTAPSWREPVIGGALGLLAGIVGIGGGIFLAPVLHMMRWGGAKAIAGTCAIFILVNSLAGLAGQLAKAGAPAIGATIAAHALLFPAVALGGLIGAAIGTTRLTARHVAIVTALLVLYVAVQLALRFARLALSS